LTCGFTVGPDGVAGPLYWPGGGSNGRQNVIWITAILSVVTIGPPAQEFVELAERELEAQVARRSQVHAHYGFPALLGTDGVSRAHIGSSRAAARLLGVSYAAHGGETAPGALSTRNMALAATAQEAFLDGTLIHADLAARSDIRRGHPTLHRHYANLHHDSDWMGDSLRMGVTLAQLIGDTVQVTACHMFDEATRDAAPEIRAYMVETQHNSQVERILGQAMDTIYPYLPDIEDPEGIIRQAFATIQAKMARYLAATPLAIGAAGAGSSLHECSIMEQTGLHLGTAYQLYADIQGALGASEVTGKPAGQDLIDGKRTVLVGVTMRLLKNKERRQFVNALLRGAAPPVEARVEHLQGVIRRSGALDAVQEMIADHRRLAIDLLEQSSLDQAGRDAITQAGDWLLTSARL
jgi:geranylgeranyl diphosphate synthase type I